MTLPDPITYLDRNFFHERNLVYIGDYVEDNHGRKGLVYGASFACPESDYWLGEQAYLAPDPMAWKNCRWVSIFVDGGGSVTVPEQLVKKIPPFVIDNPNMGMYFDPILYPVKSVQD